MFTGFLLFFLLFVLNLKVKNVPSPAARGEDEDNIEAATSSPDPRVTITDGVSLDSFFFLHM